jgi:hypothetical protein
MNVPSLDELEAQRVTREDDSIDEYLMKRALGVGSVVHSRVAARKQYVNICPTATIYEQEMPTCLKRFSLSGKVPPFA